MIKNRFSVGSRFLADCRSIVGSRLLRWKRPNSVVLIALISAGITGCASTGSGHGFTLQPPSPDTTVIYHYRPKAMRGGSIRYDVLSNDKPLTRMKNGGYFREVADPGTMQYFVEASWRMGILFVVDAVANVTSEYENAFSFVAEPGETYFLRWRSSGNNAEIELVSQEEALPALAKLKSLPPAEVDQ